MNLVIVCKRCARVGKAPRTPTGNAQFEHINTTAEAFLQRRQPVVSVDTKKKELVGEFKNAGQEWQPKGRPETALVHDFPQDSAGKAIPYGVYDMGHNEAWVNVGCDHDTPRLLWPRYDGGGPSWGSSVTPTHATCSSLPMRAVATGIVHAPGSTDCSSSPMRRVCASTSAISRRAPASGTRLSTACSATLHRIGAASRYVALRPLST